MERRSGVRVYEDKLIHVADFLSKVTTLTDPVAQFTRWATSCAMTPGPWHGNGLIGYFEFVLRLDSLPERVFLGTRWEMYDLLRTIMHRKEAASQILEQANAMSVPINWAHYHWQNLFGFVFVADALSCFVGGPAHDKTMERYFGAIPRRPKLDWECKSLKAAGAVPGGFTENKSPDGYIHIDEFLKCLESVPQHVLNEPRDNIAKRMRFYAEMQNDVKVPCFVCDQSADNRTALAAARAEITTLNEKLRALRVCLQ